MEASRAAAAEQAEREATVAAEQAERETKAAAEQVLGPVATLTSMGFSQSAVDAALEATQGSVDHAVEWLFVHATEFPLHAAEEQSPAVSDQVVPPEWGGLLEDLLEMGFNNDRAQEALMHNGGDLKQ